MLLFALYMLQLFRRHIHIYFCILFYLLVCFPLTTFRFITPHCSQWMKYSRVCRPLGTRHNIPAASDLASSIIQFGPPLWPTDQSSWLHNGDVLCFLWGTKWIYICYVEDSRPPVWSSGQSSWLHNGDVLCFLWGTNYIYICYVEESRPPLLSSGQSSWLHIQRPEFDYRRYPIFWEVLGLERGPFSLMSTIEKLLKRKK
jgi:hypothetical protein